MKNLLLVAALMTIVFFSCTSDGNKNIPDDNEKKLASDQQKEKLEEIAKLKREIESLKSRKDSVNEQYNSLIVRPAISKIILQSDLDHMNIAVNDIDKTEKYFTDVLGFTIKKGREHNNGILNSFVKFGDNSYIELITVVNQPDSSTQVYRDILKNGDAGAFVALRSDSLSSLSEYYKLLEKVTNIKRYGNDFETLEFGDKEELKNIFFINYPGLVKDDKTLLTHKNGAMGLAAVWLAAKSTDEIEKTFTLYGFKVLTGVTIPSLNIEGRIVEMNEGKIYLLPSDTSNGVFGITVLVNDVQKTHDFLKKSLKKDLKISHDVRGKSILLDPGITHNIYIEFLQKENN